MGKVNKREGGEEEEETQGPTVGNGSARDVDGAGVLSVSADGEEWFKPALPNPDPSFLLSQRLMLIQGKQTSVSNYSGVSIVAETISLAFKVSHQQVYDVNVQRGAGPEMQSLQEAEGARQQGVSWEHAQWSPQTMQMQQQEQAPASWGWSQSSPPQPSSHPSLGSAPRVLHRTKHSPFHCVPSLTV